MNTSNASTEKKPLFFVALVFFILSLGLVNNSPAQEILSASFYAGYGEITLSWDHSLAAPSVLVFSEVNVRVEEYEQGLAIANAVAVSSAMAGDIGAVGTAVAAESIILGSKGLADSQGIAQSFFLLRNTSDQHVEVNFNWSAEWLVEGAIENPEMDKVKAVLFLTLQKKLVGFNNVKVLIERIVNNIEKTNGHGSIFAKAISTHLPPELSFYDSDSVTDEFTIHMAPRKTYLFALSAELRGLATVSFGGCPASFWAKNRNIWPINPRERFVDVFGVGPNNLRLSHAVRLRQSVEGILMSNAVAALLNAASPGIPYFTDDVNAIKALVNTAFASGEFELVSDELKYYNNLGVPQVCN